MLDGPTFPEGWPRRPIYELATWTNGLAFRHFQFSDSGWPVIKIAELKEGVSGQTKFTRQTFDERYHVKSGDMLFSWSGNPETSLDVFWWRRGDGWLNQHIFKVEPTDVDSGFFYYLLRYLRPTFGEIAANKQTTGLGHVTAADLKSLLVGVPPLRIQRAIARVLGSLDDKIELNLRMNLTLEQIAQALYKFWFVDFGPVHGKAEGRWKQGESLPGMPADIWDLWPSEFEGSEIGEIPRGWEVKNLGSVSEIVDCLHAKKPERRDEGRPLLHLWNIRNDGLLDLSDLFLIDEPDYRFWTSRFEARAGDCVITNVGRVGAVAQVPQGLHAALGRNMTGIRSTSIPPTFLLMSLLSERTREEVALKMDTGTVMDALNVRGIPNLRIVVPPPSVLAAFEETCRPLRAAMESNHIGNQTLAHARDALLPKLLSGEIRVPLGGGA